MAFLPVWRWLIFICLYSAFLSLISVYAFVKTVTFAMSWESRWASFTLISSLHSLSASRLTGEKQAMEDTSSEAGWVRMPLHAFFVPNLVLVLSRDKKCQQHKVLDRPSLSLWVLGTIFCSLGGITRFHPSAQIKWRLCDDSVSDLKAPNESDRKAFLPPPSSCVCPAFLVWS